ncbi:MAG: acyltransferase [Candidatus Omnitrophota bacterium]
MSKQHEHVPALDGIRGLAILMVIFHHATYLQSHQGLGGWLIKALHMGGHGVDLFFVLSGFLITGILLDAKDRPNFFRNFYGRRTLRIFPLYYLYITFILFLLPALVPSMRQPPYELAALRQHWPWYYFYLSNFFVAQKGFFAHGGIDITWSLAIEEHFYLLWPLLVSLSDRRHIHRWLLGILSLSVLLRSLLWAFGTPHLSLYVMTFTHLDGICLGAFWAAYLRTRESCPDFFRGFARGRLMALSLAVLTALFSMGFLEDNRTFMNTLGYFVISLFFVQLLAVTVRENPPEFLRRFFSSGLLRAAGKYSYAMYLVHLPICTLLRRAASSCPSLGFLTAPNAASQILFYAAAIALTLAAAMASWHLLEKHMLKLKKLFA